MNLELTFSMTPILYSLEKAVIVLRASVVPWILPNRVIMGLSLMQISGLGIYALYGDCHAPRQATIVIYVGGGQNMLTRKELNHGDHQHVMD